MSSVMPLLPAGSTPRAMQDASPACSITTDTVEFLNIHTSDCEPASTFYALVNTIDDLADENEEPGFVHRRSTTLGNRVSPSQPVTVDVDVVQQLVGVSEQDEIADQLELYRYDSLLLFWALAVGPVKIIVGNNSGDGRYHAWLGPEAGFSTVTLAYDRDRPGIKIRKFGTEVDERPSSFFQLPATLNARHNPKLKCFRDKNSLTQSYPDGRRKVKPDVDKIKKLFDVSPDQIASELILYEYGKKYGFWTMRIGGDIVIMKGNGSRFWAWLGPGRGLSGPVATGENLNPRVTSHSDRKSNTAQLAEDQGGEGIGNQQDSREADELLASVLQKRRAFDLESGVSSDSDVTTGHDYLTRKRMKLLKDSQTIQSSSECSLTAGGSSAEDVDGEDSMEERSTADGSTQEGSTCEGSTREGSTSDGPLLNAAPVDRSMAPSPIIEGVTANDMIDALSIDSDATEKHWKVGRSTTEAATLGGARLHKLARTKLFVSVSTNNYGAVPIKMTSCQTADTFFASVLAAWDLEEREADIAAVVVQVDRDGAQDQPIVVRRKVPDSFDEMLEMIDVAACWDERGRQSCKVDVDIKMVQT